MCCRSVLVLLFMCVGNSESRVVDDFRQCPQFFFKNEWPNFEQFFRSRDSFEYICQQFETRYHFASFYLPKEFRIPLYSAYRLDELSCEGGQKRGQWCIEPSLFGHNYFLDSEMIPDHYYLHDDIMKVQAVNEDYRNTNYDKGHLNPCFYHCDDARTATFTLTNAVPQDPCFNRQKWFEMEKLSKQIMNDDCKFTGAQRFFVTGVIPSDDNFIPHYQDDAEFDKDRAFKRVNVPAIMWTAACCYYKYVKGDIIHEYGLSFSYFGQNKPDSIIKVLSVPDLEVELFNKNVQIFVDGCFSSRGESDTALNKLKNAIGNMNMNTLANMGIDPLFMKEQLNPNN